jgi:polyhydroxyalkanoate synthesis regulator protein
MEHEELVTKITTLEGSMKTAYHRIGEVEVEIKEIKSDNKILHEMNTNIRVLAEQYKTQGTEICSIKSDIKELKDKPSPQETLVTQGKEIETLKTDVKELKDKPAKRLNTIETIIITTIVGAIIGYIASKIFGG